MNNIEKVPEHIPTKEEVLSVILKHAENPVFVRELSDEQGPYLFEFKVEGKKPGEVTEFTYTRKGTFPNQNAAAETVINVVYYEDEMPVGGNSVANYNNATGEWMETK